MKTITSLAAIGATCILIACGSSGGSSEGPAPGTHQVVLPTMAITHAYAQSMKFPDRYVSEVPFSAGQPLTLQVPQDLHDSMVLVRLSSADAAFATLLGKVGPNVKIDTPQGRIGTTYGHLLLTGKQLSQGNVIFSPLSDYISRQMDDYVHTLTPERLAYYQDLIAASLIQQDITGDGVVNYSDALVFNPSNPDHLASLSFDYSDVLTRALSSGRSLKATYEAHPQEIEAALREAFDAADSVELPSAESAQTVALEIDTDKGGKITIDEMPEITLNADNPRWVHNEAVQLNAVRKFHLRAVADTDWKFIRWVGCENVAADNRCEVVADHDQRVGAQFGLNTQGLTPGIESVIKLGNFPQASHSIDLPSADTVVISNVTDPALAQELGAAKVNTVIASPNWQNPLLKITEILPTTATVPPSYSFKVMRVAMFDVYQAISSFTSTRAPTIADVQSVKLSFPSKAIKTGLNASIGSPLEAKDSSVDEAIWLAGYGRALYAGEGFYLVQSQTGKGFDLVKAEGELRQVQGRKAMSALKQACDSNPSAPDCQVVQDARRQVQAGATTCALLPVILPSEKGCALSIIEITLGKKGSIWIGKLSVEGNVDIEPIGSTTVLWTAIPVFPYVLADVAVNGRGTVKVTLAAKAFAGIQVKGEALKSAQTKSKSTGQSNEVPLGGPRAPDADAMASQISGAGGEDIDGMGRLGELAANAATLDFIDNPIAGSVSENPLKFQILVNSATPDGLVFPLQFQVGLTTKWKGKAGVTVSAANQWRFFYDVDVDIGWPCSKVLFVTVCSPLPKSTQRAEGNIKVKTYQKFDSGFVANFEFAPGIDAGFTLGPRGLREDLIKVGVTGSFPFKAVGSIQGFKSSNFPEDIAAKLPSYCGLGDFSYAVGLDFQVDVYARVDPKLGIELAGKTLSIDFLSEFDIYRWKQAWPILSPTFIKGDKSFIKNDKEACLPLNERPARYFPEKIRWATGELKVDDLAVFMTQNRKLELQPDGNFVLSKLERMNGDGKVVKETPLWATKTENYPGNRVEFQHDGNLVVTNVREKVTFASATYAKDAAYMELQKDGNLVIYNKSDAPLWSTSTQNR
jgi:hypothetical protein